ncbi:hypothetical protein [uncultured Alistipes sp.]|uniref:hypothetical protein n=1 Tax=uncultured Alistipes sp. TaxID=538949 RepID=UPI0026020939|nr:hypothetical protein [uncultured Alistipes sp.]
MKKLFLIFLMLFSSINYVMCQTITARDQDNANRSVSIGDRLTSDRIYRQFGISPLYSHDDTELLNGFVEVYKTGDGLLFSCLNSLVHDFEVTGNRYRIIIFGKYIVQVGQKLSDFRSTLRPEEVLERYYNGTYFYHFRVSEDSFCDSSLTIETNVTGTITSVGWHVPD